MKKVNGNKMNEIRVFEHEMFGKVRAVEINGEAWLVGKDVCDVLGYQNASKALLDHVDEEDKLNNETLSSLGQRGGWLINESGLYSLVLSSKLPTAKQFKRWVTADVLPSIRQNGAYLTVEKAREVISDPNVIIQLAQRVLKAEEEVKLMKPKAEYFDALVERNLLSNFRDTAKELHIGQKEFINWLMKNGYIYRDLKGRLRPRVGHEALFEVKDAKNSKHGNWVGVQTFVTVKGKETFRLLLQRQAS